MWRFHKYPSLQVKLISQHDSIADIAARSRKTTRIAVPFSSAGGDRLAIFNQYRRCIYPLSNVQELQKGRKISPRLISTMTTESKAFLSEKDLETNASRFVEFLNQTGSPYHAVEAAKNLLIQDRKVIFLDERTTWDLQRGKLYVVTRNASAICAFYIGKSFVAAEGGFNIVAAHTDSPCLRIRPNNHIEKEKVHQCGVECYGGGLWHTWFDRGLGFAGKVVVKTGSTGFSEKLIRISRPVAILPNLAIHLQTADEISAFKINKESNLQPILCSEIFSQLLDTTKQESESKDVKVSPPLLSVISENLQVSNDDILDVDICLMDATPSRRCGVNSEFIESPRLDNIASLFAAFEAIRDVGCDEKSISVSVAFDHEEVGSESFVGANSSLLETWLKRIASSLEIVDKVPEIFSRSFLISADMAHAVHPNYPEKHQSQHKPLIHKGIVLKENSNQRYATGCTSMALTRRIAENVGVPLQEFCVRNDSRCGSTVGPFLSSKLGIRTIDIGIPQWAMHSCRESCGIVDVYYMVKFLKGFFSLFRDIDETMTRL